MNGRTPIHYGVFLVAGLLITVISLLTLRTTENPEAMQLFAGIGGLFLVIGIGKFFLRKIKDVGEAEKGLENRIAGGMLNPTPAPQPKQTPKPIIVCSRCETRNYASSNYCHMCGLRLK
jgi:hypothetical protein